MEAEPRHPPIEQNPAMPLSAAADAFTPDAMDTAEAPVGMVDDSEEDEPSASWESDEDGDSAAEGPEPDGNEAATSPGATVPSTDAAGAAQGPGTDLQTQLSGSSWAQKRPLPAPVAVGKRPAVSPTSSGDSKAAGERTVKRRNLFPKIKASEKCGKCENCLNPQRKKACIEARRRQMELMKPKQPAGQQRSTASARPAAAPAAAADNPAANDPYLRELERIMSPSGAVVQAKNIPMLLQLLRSARTLAHRFTVMTVLERSPAEVLQAVVRQGALLQLQSWLGQYLADHKPKGTAKILTCLSRLPVTTEALKPPCELGKMVGKLRKEESLEPATREQARLLVAKWKRVVEQEKQSHSRDGAGATTAQDGSLRAGDPSARPAAVAAAGIAASARQAGTTSAGNSAPAKPFAAVADDDMFAAADKQRATVKEAAAQQRKVVRLEIEPTRGRPAGAAAEPAQPLSPTSAAGDTAPSTSSAAAARAKAEFSKASSSPFDSLSSFSAGVSMIGSAGTSTTLSRIGSSFTSAAQRAAEAAKRVPSPEPPAERKEKRKKVSWVKEDALADVRWFLKVDPPVAAKSDADLSEQRQAAAAAEGPAEPDREASPPGFEMAAKKEHLSEAEALRRHREEEDEERSELEDRLSHMMASVPWFDPPLLATASAAAMVQLELAPGSESEERQRQAARCTQASRAAYASLAAVPASPAEPHYPADLGVAQPLHQIPRIPLSLEEAAALKQAQQPQQQQQQAQHAQLAGQPPQMQQQQFAGQQQLLQQQGPIHAQGQMPMQHPGPMLVPGMLPAVSQPPGSQPPPTSGMLALQLPNGQVDAGVLAQLASSGLLQAPQGLPPGAILLPAQQQQQQGAPPGTRPAFHNPAQRHQHQQQPGLAPFGQPGPVLVQGPAGTGQQPAQAAPAYLPQQPRLLQGPPGVLTGSAQPSHPRPGQLPLQQQPQQQYVQQQPQQWGSQQPRPTGAPLPVQPWQQQQQQQPLAAGPAGAIRPQFGQGQLPAPQQQPAQQQQQQHNGHPQRRQIPCKFFNTPKGCVHGDNCRFAHIPANQGAPGSYSNHGSHNNKRGRPDDSVFDRGGNSLGGQQRSKQPRVWDRSGPSRR